MFFDHFRVQSTSQAAGLKGDHANFHHTFEVFITKISKIGLQNFRNFYSFFELFKVSGKLAFWANKR